MVGIADVAADRQPHQLAAEVILQTGADDLLTVVEIFRADKTDHRIDQQRIKMAGNGIGARFAGLLIDAVMRIGGEGASLAGFEIHHVVAEGAAIQA